MQLDIQNNSLHIVCAIAVAIFGVTGCTNPPVVSVNTVLTKVGKLAEDSFYACLLNSYTQGLSLVQARAECETKLLEDDKKGFGGSLGDIAPGSEDFFDPAKITAACNSGDPTRGQSSGMGTKPGMGQYTWGEKSNEYYGLSKEESLRQKEENIAAAENEMAKFDKLAEEELKKGKELEEAKKTGDAAAEKKAEEERKAAYEAAVDQLAKAQRAEEKAKADPNEKPQPVGQTVDGETPCEQALQSARELLRECHRTNWKDFRCQELQAKMKKCPDPALILVDPDQGYSCGATIDPEAVKNAWVALCWQRVKFGPGGPNPCEPPSVDKSGRFVKGEIGDICNDPQALIDPDSDRCNVVTIGKEFGQPNVQEILILGCNKLGGPCFVIPKDPKPPRPGPDPRPGPRGQTWPD